MVVVSLREVSDKTDGLSDADAEADARFDINTGHKDIGSTRWWIRISVWLVSEIVRRTRSR